MKYLVIKVVRPDFNNDSLEETKARTFVRAIKHIDKWANDKGWELLFSPQKTLRWVQYDAIADVYSPEELTVEEREFITNELSVFGKDAPAWRDNAKQYQLPMTIFFHIHESYAVSLVEGDKLD